MTIPKKSAPRLTLSHLGQIQDGTLEFGDLTVLVGPQATGKSILLQWLKLIVDAPAILTEFNRSNIEWKLKGNKEKQWLNFLDLFFGEGMSGIWDDERTHSTYNGQKVQPGSLTRIGNKKTASRMFFIPAQRVMSLREGMTRPFAEYRTGDPFVLREFSERLHRMIQGEFSKRGTLFPQQNRLNESFRKPIADHIFGGYGLQTDMGSLQRRMTLVPPNGHAEEGITHSLPYLVWSAGQREFVPLLLGFYWLMPPAKVSRRDEYEWVVIEEPEMGLHPNAISVVLMLVLELMRRGYRVCLSTHSPHVLDVVWALGVLRSRGGVTADVRRIFNLGKTASTEQLARSALDKFSKVYYFTREGEIRDISELDPGSTQPEVAGWGGLSGFSGDVADIVAEVVQREMRSETR